MLQGNTLRRKRSLWLLKQVDNEAAGKRHRRRNVFQPPTPSCRNSSFPEGVTLRIFRGENEVGYLFQRFLRLLKIFSSKAAEGIAPVFYCTLVGRRVVMLHQFVKKSEKTPLNELKIGRKRMKKVKDAKHS